MGASSLRDMWENITSTEDAGGGEAMQIPIELVNWLSPILSAIIVAVATQSINAKIVAGERKRDEARNESTAWRQEVDGKLDAQGEQMGTLMRAQQTTMRATLIHNSEKYMERGWITPEERASWCDMHDQYSALGANGLIETYRHKLNELPDRQI